MKIIVALLVLLGLMEAKKQLIDEQIVEPLPLGDGTVSFEE